MVAYSESAIRAELLGEGISAPSTEAVIAALHADGAFAPGSPGGGDALYEVLPAGDSTPTDPTDEAVKFLSAGAGPFTGAQFADGGTHLDAIIFKTTDNVTVDMTNDGTLVTRTLITGSGDDSVTLTGNASHYIDVGGGANFVVSGKGADSIFAGSGADTIQGGAGNDTIVGGGGADQLSGQKGNDVIFGGGDQDQLFGNQGNDKFVIQAYSGIHESVTGGGGNDKIIFTDYLKSDATFTHSHGALVITFTDGHVVTVKSVETLVFSDGTVKHIH